ncbi:MAG: DUF4242 domain-containing protein [Acidimicrobiales bacterium]
MPARTAALGPNRSASWPAAEQWLAICSTTPRPLAAIASKSNGVLRDLGPDVQWVHSYVSDDKITCVYVAPNEEAVREHGRCGGFPVDAVHEVRAIIDPVTAERAP